MSSRAPRSQSADSFRNSLLAQSRNAARADPALDPQTRQRLFCLDLKGPKTPMQGWLRENRQEYVAIGAWGGALDPEEPRSSCQAKHLPT